MKSINKRIGLVVMLLSLLVITTACNTAVSNNEVSTEPTATSEAVQSTEATTAANTETTEAYEPYYIEDFELKSLDGSVTSLHAFEGKMIVLNFWATWCTYCKQEMPLLEELSKRDDVVVIAVSVGEDAKTVQDYIDENGYTFDVFLDEEGTLASMFGVTGFPTSMFIGTDMEYFYSFPGMLTQESLDNIFTAIDEILEARK